MTPSGIEPATFRFVAQHLNHCATAVPICVSRILKWILQNEFVNVCFGSLGLGPVTGIFVMFCTYTFTLDRLKERLLPQEDCIHTLMPKNEWSLTMDIRSA